MRNSITGANDTISGIALRWYRELKFVSLTEVAEEAGISKAYLSLLELGKKPLNRKLEKRIYDAIDSMTEKTRIGTLKFAIWRINLKVFRDSNNGEYRWTGSYINDDTFQFMTEGIKVELLTSPTEEEELTVQVTGKPLVSGRIRVDTPNKTKVRHFLICRDRLEASLEDFGLVTGPKVAALLEELKRTLSLHWEVRPKTIGKQLNEILKAKS